MGAQVGDVLVVESEKVGLPDRCGEILEIIEASYGTRYRVRWDDGHESIYYPSSDATVRQSVHHDA